MIFCPTKSKLLFHSAMLLLALILWAGCANSAPAPSLPLRVGTIEKSLVSTDEVLRIARLNLRFNKPLEGKFAFAFTERNSEKLMRVVVVSKSEKESNKQVQVTIYPILRVIESDFTIVFDPLISPNGRYILFKYGPLSDPFDSYSLYILDTQINEIIKGYDRSLSYGVVSWSPDGKYIALIEGGVDSTGNTVKEAAAGRILNFPLKLVLYDWINKRRHSVVENDSVRGPFAWVSSHTLLYGVFPKAIEEEKQQPNEKVVKQTSPKEILLPNIYSYSVESKTSKLLINDAYFPQPSPNGKKVAFFGSENPLKPKPISAGWMFRLRGAALSVADVNGENRIAFTTKSGMYPIIIWFPDSNRFLEIQQTQFTPNASAKIIEWNVLTQDFKEVGSISANDYKKVSNSPLKPKFLPMGLSEDGRLFYVLITEWVKNPEENNSSLALRTLCSIDLSSGRVSRLTEILGSSVDWLYTSDS